MNATTRNKYDLDPAINYAQLAREKRAYYGTPSLIDKKTSYRPSKVKG